MRIFVIGATGFVGSHLARSFVAAGHDVRGLTRTEHAAQRLRAAAIDPVRGDLEHVPEGVLTAARHADAVVFAAQPAPDVETAAVAQLLDAMTGSGRTFVFTSGSGVLLQRTGGRWSADSFAENDDFVVEPLAASRLGVERSVCAAAARGIRAMVIRPGMIWGPGDHSHVDMIYASVARTGTACYVGEGLNVYSNVHLDDVARLYDLALAKGQPGAVYHAVGGETPTRWIAESVAADLGVPTRSLSIAEATEVWGDFGALIASASSRIRAERSHAELGWRPEHTDMLSTIGQPR